MCEVNLLLLICRVTLTALTFEFLFVPSESKMEKAITVAVYDFLITHNPGLLNEEQHQ